MAGRRSTSSQSNRFTSPLQGAPNVILTPLVGGSTEEAQHYQTDGEIGYVVLDTDGVRTDAEDILRDIRGLSGTIRTRVLNQPS